MASWSSNFGGSAGANYQLIVDVALVSQDTAANTSVIQYHAYMHKSAGTGYYDTSASGDTNINGYDPARSWGAWDFRSYTDRDISGYENYTINHDVNGNANPYFAAYWLTSSSYVTSASAGGNYALPRLALAPTISSTISSNLKPKTATIAGAVSSNGHGTSTTITYFYRVSGVGSYTNAGTGASVNLTGLKPNTTYDWYITAANNNGDTATSAIQNFKTQAISGMISVVQRII